jgi:hypothetical protein
MRIIRRAEYLWSDKQDRYITLRILSTKWTGPVMFAKGASAQQQSIGNSQQNFYNTLSQDYGQQFASQNAILGSLTKALNPIISAGPNQFGFSNGETNSLNSQAIQGTGQQYNAAKQNLAAQQAASGGGNAVLPSGVQQQQTAGLATSAANQTSNQLLGIQQAGYQQGNQQFNQAVGQLGGVASQYNAAGFAGQATGAGSAASSTANQIAQENNAASPWGLIGGILGGAAQGVGQAAMMGFNGGSMFPTGPDVGTNSMGGAYNMGDASGVTWQGGGTAGGNYGSSE